MRLSRFTRKRYLVITTLGILVPTVFLALLSLRLQREMFRFQNDILQETALFTAEHAVSQVQDLIRAREREIHMHYRMVAMLQHFDPGVELRRVEQSYPLVARAFLMRLDREIAFAAPPDVAATTGAEGVATPVGPRPSRASMLSSSAAGGTDSMRQRAVRIVDEVLDPATVEHLLRSGEPHFFRGREGGEPFHITAFGLFDADGSPEGVAGFFLNLSYVRESFLARVLEEAIDAVTESFSPRFGRELTFAVYDHDDKLVYAHERGGRKFDPEASPVLAESELWDVLPGWTVRLHYGSPKGPTYQRNIWLSNTLLLVVAGTIAIVGILLSMRFLLRQMELANLKSHFVSNITHELKTPLAAIRLYTETLEEGRFEDEEQKSKFLAIIHKETIRLTHLINNILDFSSIEQGKKRYRFEPTAVGQVVHEVLEAYSYQMRSKGFDVSIDVEAGLPPVWVDRDALSQAVLNLVDNAVKYSGQSRKVEVQVVHENGRPPAVVPPREGTGMAAEPSTPVEKPEGTVDPRRRRERSQARRSQGNAATVSILVRDRGVGIPASEQARIFDVFYRVDKGLEHDVKGSGLGLAVVKHIVEAHGGTIQLQSRQGQGSTFIIRLPISTEPPRQQGENGK